MPCWATRKITLDLTAANQDLLTQALTAVGFIDIRQGRGGLTFASLNGVGVIANGRITLDERDAALVNPLKQAYSRLTLQTVAKKYGWTLKGSGQEFTLQKRSF